METALLEDVGRPIHRRLFCGKLEPEIGSQRHECICLSLLHHIIMLSRAVLPLTRPNVLASAVRVSALSAQRPRWYAKGKDNTPYELPQSLKPETTAPKKKSKGINQTQQSQHAKEQPEFDPQAKPESDAVESNTVRLHAFHQLESRKSPLTVLFYSRN